jgi:hypothetical protein
MIRFSDPYVPYRAALLPATAGKAKIKKALYAFVGVPLY